MHDRTVARITASSDVRMRMEAVVCDTCQDLCWSVEVWLHQLAGTDARACILYREHLASQAQALGAIGRWSVRYAHQVEEVEARVWAMEHQLSLIDDI